MLKIVRTDSNNIDFVNLVKDLDRYLKTTDGDEHDFYNQFNNIDVLKHVIIAYIDSNPVGCGAFKTFNDNTIEIKRMYTKPEFRSQGIAGKILQALEHWANEIGYTFSILETGKRQLEAVQFYKKCDYKIISNYGQYTNMKNSLCFKKILS
ncbi:GNAT family N-acetyltransferase [uncultured Lacinutrix sp.]|uniref:GNAT family N-acetyltransferase n=1 Tax=uncultured Lacinutrix sp. TaxID=574032 RepID=UPI00262957B2|nr:GNAT family N-acetyltransferase [uncultured Lacinutrix sp.]